MKKNNKFKTLNSFEHLAGVLIPSDIKKQLEDAKTFVSNQSESDKEFFNKKTSDMKEYPQTIYLDPMTEQQGELQYGAVVDPAETKRVSLIAKHNNRRW